MAGEIIYNGNGRIGLPAYDTRQGIDTYGKILYRGYPKVRINAHITIAWSDGMDVDIACFWTDKPDMIVGWDYGDAEKADDNYKLKWYGDQTTGGPEYVDFIYTPNTLTPDLSKLTAQICCNWYSKGEDHTGGNIVISGGEQSCSIVASDRRHSKAIPSDPGVLIRFQSDGNIASIKQW